MCIIYEHLKLTLRTAWYRGIDYKRGATPMRAVLVWLLQRIRIHWIQVRILGERAEFRHSSYVANSSSSLGDV
jgi:hypothetical protein